MALSAVLLVVVILLLIGVIPAWPHSRGWDFAPSGLIGALLVVLLVLTFSGCA
jgi:hypothetical protein